MDRLMRIADLIFFTITGAAALVVIGELLIVTGVIPWLA